MKQDKEKMVVTSMNIPEELREYLQTFAEIHKWSVSQAAAEIIKAYRRIQKASGEYKTGYLRDGSEEELLVPVQVGEQWEEDESGTHGDMVDVWDYDTVSSDGGSAEAHLLFFFKELQRGVNAFELPRI